MGVNKEPLWVSIRRLGGCHKGGFLCINKKTTVYYKKHTVVIELNVRLVLFRIVIRLARLK